MKIIISLVFILLSAFSLSAQQYKPVDEQSEVKFIIKNFGINTPGSFGGLKGSIQFNPSNLSASSFNVSVDVNTVNTGIDMRDSHLKKEEYFYAEKFPTINFISANITGDQNKYTVTGRLTIKGITKNISFPFTLTQQGDGVLFNGNFSINRKDFNVGGGSPVMGNNVDLSLKVFAEN